MKREAPEGRPLDDPEAQLERAFIEEFIRARGYDPGDLHSVPEEQLKHLLEEASTYAAAKLAQVEARAHFVHEMHRKE